MSFDCRYKGSDYQCLKLNKKCSPGCKGCVLYGRFYMPFKEEKQSTKDDKKHSYKRYRGNPAKS